MGYKINYSVYKIKNKITNQCYIGVDSYYPKRIRQHQSMLRNNKHRNKHLQSSYNKYGVKNFIFELLESCKTREIMLNKEIEYIKYFKSLEKGFNHTKGGEGSYGYKHSKETLFKMSSWKRIITDEWKNNISKATKGVKKKKGIKRKNHPDYNKWLGGEKHPTAKFKQSDINEIRNLYSNGMSLKDLSIKFNSSKTYICNIVNNLFWFDPNYTKDVITNHIICIEDNLEFKSIKETLEYYGIKSNSSLSNNLKGLSNKINTIYGKNHSKKYRLIREYPGSPELGEIWEKQGEYDDYYYGKSPRPWIYKGLVENQPEFWEEVIDKDYEIITFGCEGGFDRTLNKYGGYSLITGRDTYPMGKKYSTLIESPNYYIKSVKRLSDGVTFTIGDMCNPASTCFNYNKRPITKIWFTDFNSLRISSENYTLPINGIEHSEIPIFTSEDGVDIYEGDKYYYVSESGKGVYTLITKNEKPLSGNGKRFSTKKAAENYISNSEKRFSINDVINSIPLDSGDVTTTLSKMLDNLKSLAQTAKE